MPGNNEPTGVTIVTTGAGSPPAVDANENFLIGLG